MANYNKTPGRIVLSIRIDGNVAARLRGASKAGDVTIGFLVEDAVTAYLKELEKSRGKRFKALPPRKRAA